MSLNTLQVSNTLNTKVFEDTTSFQHTKEDTLKTLRRTHSVGLLDATIVRDILSLGLNAVDLFTQSITICLHIVSQSVHT